MDEPAQVANYHEQQIDEGIEQRQGMLRADLDEAPCHLCGEIERKANMDWLHNALGEQGWCCKECQAEGEAS